MEEAGSAREEAGPFGRGIGLSGSAFEPSVWFTRPSGRMTEVPCAHGKPEDHHKAIDREGRVGFCGPLPVGLDRTDRVGSHGLLPVGLDRGCRVGLDGLWPVEPNQGGQDRVLRAFAGGVWTRRTGSVPTEFCRLGWFGAVGLALAGCGR